MVPMKSVFPSVLMAIYNTVAFFVFQQLYQTLTDFDIRFYMFELLKVRTVKEIIVKGRTFSYAIQWKLWRSLFTSGCRVPICFVFVIIIGWFKRSLNQSIGSFSANPHFALFRPDQRSDIFGNVSNHWGMVTYTFFLEQFFWVIN